MVANYLNLDCPPQSNSEYGPLACGRAFRLQQELWINVNELKQNYGEEQAQRPLAEYELDY
jgi:hypothetical protein